MKRFEYDLEEFTLTERWSSKRQRDSLNQLKQELNQKGAEGWEMMGIEAFELVGGITGGSKGTIYISTWKRETN